VVFHWPIQTFQNGTFSKMRNTPADATENVKPNDPLTREELHFRRIDMRGWRRSDGLFEVEGRVTDRKPHEFQVPNGTKVVPANAPLHDMGVKLVFDDNMLVHDVFAFTDAAPYTDCLAAGPTLQTLKGMRIAAGWGAEVTRRLAGANSCTHLMQLLIPMGTTAFQSLTTVRMDRPEPVNAEGKPVKINSCFAYAADRSLVMHKWPAFYTGQK
jgi:hypothetical protein